MTVRAYKPINVSRPSWERYAADAEIIRLNLGLNKLSLPQLLDMAVTLLEKEHGISHNM